MASMTGGGMPWRGLALALGTWAFAGPRAEAQGVGPAAEVVVQPGPRAPGPGFSGFGSNPGFPGFGLSYHPGYGYGGAGLGVSPGGGYPGYGGPGYPHPGPQLRRCAPDPPFLYFGGSGPNCSPRPNEFLGVGPLVVDRQVAVESDSPDLGYGPYTGARPYSDAFFAPNAAAASATRSGDGATPSDLPAPPDDPAPGEAPRAGARGRDLGIDDEAVVGADGARGLKVAAVRPGTAAAAAGLRAGDLIRSINGYFTAERGNLTWIVAHAAPDGVLTMIVRGESDGKDRVVTARLRIEPALTARPPYLPPVGNGPPPATR